MDDSTGTQGRHSSRLATKVPSGLNSFEHMRSQTASLLEGQPVCQLQREQRLSASSDSSKDNLPPTTSRKTIVPPVLWYTYLHSCCRFLSGTRCSVKQALRPVSAKAQLLGDLQAAARSPPSQARLWLPVCCARGHQGLLHRRLASHATAKSVPRGVGGDGGDRRSKAGKRNTRLFQNYLLSRSSSAAPCLRCSGGGGRNACAAGTRS